MMALRYLGVVALGALSLSAQNDNVITTNGPVTTVRGSSRITPAAGTAGTGVTFNFLPYILPGEYANPTTNQIENDPFDIAYTDRSKPIQTSDWWTGIGLQWKGWVVGRAQNEGSIGRTTAFISEPFHMQFLDVNPIPANVIPGIPLPVHGLRMWNQNAISVKTDGRVKDGDPFDPSLNMSSRGNVAVESSPVVTVGLANVHPLGLEAREKAPFSNVKVQSYSDWGVVLGYSEAVGSMTITAANGSPFVWFEKSGPAAFTVWAGDLDSTGALNVWYNDDNIIGVTVTTAYNPFNGLPRATSTASYVVFADTGQWIESKSTSQAVSMFTNGFATRVAVLAMPHNLTTDPKVLAAAMQQLKPYACKKISGTKLHYPPIPGSDGSVVAGGQNLKLGYDIPNSIVRTKHEILTTGFTLTGCPSDGPALQVVFPHHRKAMIASSQANILMTGSTPKYMWNSVIGPLYGYEGNSYVRELKTKGLLPHLPSVAFQSGMRSPVGSNPTALEDVYSEMKRWYFVEEPIPPPNHLDSFVRNKGTYAGVQTNTYMQALAAVYESMTIADQLSQTSDAASSDAARAFGNEIDPDLGRTKAAVAAEMRDELLQSLKELVGQWADVYSTQFFTYNTTYNSFFGFPDGYGSVQNFNDHHFHYGYFLRAAAMIGRHDPAWLSAYMPLIDQLRRDVATYNRADTEYPFLREFSPFYGHSWANGTSDAGGNDQESTSEALNFAVGLMELGLLLENPEWRDLGMYMFEEEILSAEQYWFNQDANLTTSSGSFYNGNWPDAFVHFTGPDSTPWITSLVTNVKQFGVFRNTFFGGIQGSYTIQATPMSAFTLYLGRNPNWLSATWQQYVKETSTNPDPGVYEVIASSLQSRLPGSGTTINDPGLAGALARIERLHNFFMGSTNAMGKYWAYTNAQLGQVDATVVADTPMYGVFKNGQNRTYVAYNSTNLPIQVKFTDTVSGATRSLTVPAFTMASQTDGQAGVHIDEATSFEDDSDRLYLRSGGRLLPKAGGFLLAGGQSPFPSSAAALVPQLEVVAARPDPSNSPLVLPPASYIETWTGKFAGQLIAEGKPLTRFSLYTNQALFPGWQQDPPTSANVVTVRFLYDFDSNGTADRVEILQNVPVFYGNSFLYKSQITEYYFDQIYGGQAGTIPVFVGDGMGGGAQAFPDTVSEGTLTIQIYGGSGGQKMFPVSVSEEASPLLNRASWVKPPYHE